jgi:chaperone required for assembly of F1-ATPase
MRDIFTEIFEDQPLDPMESARRGARAPLRKRFYERAYVGRNADEGEGGFALLLDGKPVKTPARRALAAPVLPLAEAIAQEWNAQHNVIDPARMPLTRLANVTIDAVADQRAAVAAEIESYLGSDLLFYRAEGPDRLIERQAQLWDPVLDWARETLGARFVLAQGVMPVAQPREAVAAAAKKISGDVWRLAALASITTLTGSGLLALALAEGALDTGAAWAVAHVDEDWQMSQWGRDELAMQRRAAREAEMRAAATVLDLTRSLV